MIGKLDETSGFFHHKAWLMGQFYSVHHPQFIEFDWQGGIATLNDIVTLHVFSVCYESTDPITAMVCECWRVWRWLKAQNDFFGWSEGLNTINFRLLQTCVSRTLWFIRDQFVTKIAPLWISTSTGTARSLIWRSQAKRPNIMVFTNISISTENWKSKQAIEFLGYTLECQDPSRSG